MSCGLFHLRTLLGKWCGMQAKWWLNKEFFRNLGLHLHCWLNEWLPVTTAWRTMKLRMEERPVIWTVAANMLNKQPRKADKGWFPSLAVGRGANNSSRLERILLRNIHRQSLWRGLILWYDLSNERVTWDLVLGMLGTCTGQVHLQEQPGNWLRCAGG